MNQRMARKAKRGNANVTVGQRFITGRQAEDIFESWLPESWLPRKQVPDFFVDHMVEIVENGEPTGRKFAVQVKGVKVGEDSASPLTFPVKGKHARYWLEKCQFPVFLFLIDVTKRAGHWIFVQKFLSEEVSAVALEKQRTITVRFHPENNLANRDGFIAQVASAEKYVKDLHPGSVEAALAKTRKALEKLEPRLNYGIVATEDGQAIRLKLKEPFGLSFTVGEQYAKEALDAYRNAVEHGTTFRLSTEGVKFAGSPLFEKLSGQRGELVLNLAQAVPGMMLIQLPTSAKTQVLPVSGEFRCGTKTARFKGETPRAPLQIEAVFELESEPSNLPTRIALSLSLERWQGLPVLALPFFDSIQTMAELMKAEGKLNMDWSIGGVDFAGGFISHSPCDNADRFSNALSWIARLRLLAEKFRINLPFPGMNTLTEKQFDLVNQLATIVTEGEFVTACPRFQATVALSNFPEGMNGFSEVGTFALDNQEETELFGHTFDFGPTRIFFTNTRVFDKGINAKGHRILKLEGTDSSQRIIRRSNHIE